MRPRKNELRNKWIEKLWHEGFTYQEIANELDLTRGTVAGVLRDLKERTEPEPVQEVPPLAYLEIFNLARKGEAYSRIARKFKTKPSVVNGIYHRHVEAIERDNLDLEICELISEGFKNPQICRMAGVGRAQVQRMRRILEKPD